MIKLLKELIKIRLWHWELLSYLPRSQILSQWRELSSIYSKQDNHILINYIYNYDKSYLRNYSNMVIREMYVRGYNIKSFDKYNNYFSTNISNMSNVVVDLSLVFKEHNDEYLSICYFNLFEKYRRGQSDFDKARFQRMKYEFLGRIFDDINDSMGV